MSDTLLIPTIRERKRMGQIRHVVIHAVRVTEGKVADLSGQVAKELAEIQFLPEIGNAFLPHMLATADVSAEELLSYCKAQGTQDRVLMSFFTNLSPADAEWHFDITAVDQGIVVKAIVGHPSAMKVARDHDYVN